MFKGNFALILRLSLSISSVEIKLWSPVCALELKNVARIGSAQVLISMYSARSLQLMSSEMNWMGLFCFTDSNRQFVVKQFVP